MNNTTNSWEEKAPEPISAQIEGWEERFDNLNSKEMFVTGDADYYEIKDFIRAEIEKERANTIADCVEIVEKWKNDNARPESAIWCCAEEIKEEIDLAITQVHGGGNGRRLLEQLRDALSH